MNDASEQPQTEIGIELMGMAEFLALAASCMDQAPPPPPARGSEEYRMVIKLVSEIDNIEEVTNAMHALHDDYGWRALFDLMTVWAQQIESSPQMHRRYRDASGVVDLTTLIVIGVDEEKDLRMAAARASVYEQEGMSQQEALRKALTEAERGAQVTDFWHPHITAALAAAHQSDDPGLIRAALARVPGARTDRRTLLEGASILGTIAYAARHQDDMDAAYRAHAEGKTVTGDRSITPGWDTGGGYIHRDALNDD